MALSTIAPVILRRRYVCAYEVGPRPTPEPSRLLRAGRRAVLPLTALACAVTDERVLALTYDDGPDETTTPEVLDALGEYGVRATFFVLTDQARRHPDLLRRIVAQGHELGLHGRDHRRLTTLPRREAVAEIRRGQQILEDLAGIPIALYRPAYGAQSLAMARAARRLGLEVVVWTAWAQDWLDEPTADLTARALRAAHPGGIMLLHDAATGNQPDADGQRRLPSFSRGGLTRGLLEGLLSRGYTATTVTGLLAGRTPGRTPWFETARQARTRSAADRGGAPT